MGSLKIQMLEKTEKLVLKARRANLVHLPPRVAPSECQSARTTDMKQDTRVPRCRYVCSAIFI